MSERQRVEVIAGVERRRLFMCLQRARIVTETFQPVVSIVAAARRHDLPPELLYLWRSRLKQAGLLAATQVDDAEAFVQAATVASDAEVVVRVYFQDPLVIDFPVVIDAKEIAEILRPLRD